MARCRALVVATLELAATLLFAGGAASAIAAAAPVDMDKCSHRWARLSCSRAAVALVGV